MRMVVLMLVLLAVVAAILTAKPAPPAQDGVDPADLEMIFAGGHAPIYRL